MPGCLPIHSTRICRWRRLIATATYGCRLRLPRDRLRALACPFAPATMLRCPCGSTLRVWACALLPRQTPQTVLRKVPVWKHRDSELSAPLHFAPLCLRPAIAKVSRELLRDNGAGAEALAVRKHRSDSVPVAETRRHAKDDAHCVRTRDRAYRVKEDCSGRCDPADWCPLRSALCCHETVLGVSQTQQLLCSKPPHLPKPAGA